jgi:hypothetical protein
MLLDREHRGERCVIVRDEVLEPTLTLDERLTSEVLPV